MLRAKPTTIGDIFHVIIIGKIQHISESESWKFFWNKIENNAW